MRERAQTHRMIKGMDSKKGMRQPQSSMASLPTNAVTKPATPVARDKPKVAAAGLNAPKKPRLPGGEHSATYVAAPVISPPAKKPCSKRHSKSKAGAARPRVA